MYVDTKEPSKVTLQPSLRNLVTILRNREMWPEGFVWYFPLSDSCAMGLSIQLWNEDITYEVGSDETFHNIFNRPISWWKIPFNSRQVRMAAVTPEVVADRIDSYLDKHD